MSPPGGYAVAPNQSHTIVVPPHFGVEWNDVHGTKEDVKDAAQECQFAYEGDSVTLELENGTLFEAERDANAGKKVFRGQSPMAADSAKVAVVANRGPHKNLMLWRAVTHTGDKLEPDDIGKISVSTRLRLSVYAFGPPLRQLHQTGRNADAEARFKAYPMLDPVQLDLLEKSGIDDVSLVYTMCFDETHRPQFLPGKDPREIDPAWPPALRLSSGLGLGKDTTEYFAQLVGALHGLARPVQVLGGYTMGPNKEPEFFDFLQYANDDQISVHADQIVGKCNELGLDGVAFDLEINEFKPEYHRKGLQLLLRSVAASLAAQDKIMTYAPGPFSKDGEGFPDCINAQSYALAREPVEAGKPSRPLPNVIVRPQCYGGILRKPGEPAQPSDKDDHPFADSMIVDGVACALRKPDDDFGGGLHPAQLQMIIVHQAIGSLCTSLLRPNRVGLVVYRLWTAMNKEGGCNQDPLEVLRSCAKLNAQLNPEEAPPGTVGQPLQVPRGIDSL